MRRPYELAEHFFCIIWDQKTPMSIGKDEETVYDFLSTLPQLTLKLICNLEGNCDFLFFIISE